MEPLKLRLTKDNAGLGLIEDADGVAVAFVCVNGYIYDPGSGDPITGLIANEMDIVGCVDDVDAITPGDQRQLDADEGVNQEVQGQ